LACKTTANVLATLLILLAASGWADGLSASRLRLTPDVTTRLRGGLFSDQDVVSISPDAVGPLAPSLAAVLPQRVQLNALMVTSNLVVFAPDVPFSSGAQTFTPRDLVAYNASSGTLSPYFLGALAGIPARACIDAAALLPRTSRILLSFDVTLPLPPLGTVQDEDIVVFQGTNAVALIAGRTLGIPAAADLDALYHDGTNIVFSLDIAATVAGQAGTRSDLWQCRTNPLTMTRLSGIGLDERVDLVALDALTDEDDDWLSDFEEISGQDDPATTLPGTSLALTPNGFASNPRLADSDYDGASDGEEALAGTQPTNSASCLRLTRIASSSTNRVVVWSSVSGKRYALDAVDRLDLPFTPLLENLVASGATMTVTNASGNNALFYRIRLAPVIPGSP
jgi:hypothetical protein